MRKIKITKEQYDRLVNTGLIKEGENRKETAPNAGDEFSKEVENFLGYLYRETEQFSPFWEKNGLTYDEICDNLFNKKIIIRKGGSYKLNKALGSTEQAKATLEQELRKMANIQEPVEEDYPLGAEHDPTAPYNQNDPEEVINESDFNLIVYNQEIAILRDKYTKQYLVLDLLEYVDGHVNSDDDIIEFLNNDSDTDKKLIPLDLNLIDELAGMYNLNDFFIKKLEQIKQSLTQGGIGEGVIWADSHKDINPEPKKRTAPENSKILDKLASLKDREELKNPPTKTKHPLDPHPEDKVSETSAAGGSSGAFNAPLSMGPIKKTQQVAESTIASTGNFQYDTPGLVGITQDGKYTKAPKTKAQKSTQWAGGSFVDIDNCTKLDNNKTAQNGGCSTGAIDNVVKTTKTKKNINAPSLNENDIIEEIANKTGKTIDEIKEILKKANIS